MGNMQTQTCKCLAFLTELLQELHIVRHALGHKTSYKEEKNLSAMRAFPLIVLWCSRLTVYFRLKRKYVEF